MKDKLEKEEKKSSRLKSKRSSSNASDDKTLTEKENPTQINYKPMVTPGKSPKQKLMKKPMYTLAPRRPGVREELMQNVIAS